MLRDKNLIPLSHQHQHALAMCVRLERALARGDADPQAWQEEIASIWEREICFHFEAEEQVLFPAAEQYAPLRPLVRQLVAEHGALRGFFARAKMRQMDAATLKTLGETLSRHIRTEERQLFEETVFKDISFVLRRFSGMSAEAIEARVRAAAGIRPRSPRS